MCCYSEECYIMARCAYYAYAAKGADVIINLKKTGVKRQWKKQNSFCKNWKKHANELPETRRSPGNAKPDRGPEDSYQWFLDRRTLSEVFDDISPIADYGGKLSLEFIDFTFDEKEAKYTIEQCKEHDALCRTFEGSSETD